MLPINKKLSIERSIIGTMVSHPNIGIKIAPTLHKDYFSSSALQEIYNYIIIEASLDRQVVMKEIISSHVDKEELKICLVSDDLTNFNANLTLLYEEYNLMLLYRLGEHIRDMVTGERNVNNILKTIEKSVAQIIIEEKDDFNQSMGDVVEKIEDDVLTYKEYPIGEESIDEYIPISSQSITILGGNEGTFKTKFMIFMMRKLLTRYDNISVLWYSMEDPADKIIRGFISQSVLKTEKEIRRMDYKKLIPEDVKKFDIEFVTESSNIKDIGRRYQKFRDKREGKFCILIVDNIMKVKPVSGREEDVDMEIVREIENWNVKTSPKEMAVYLLHHLVKANMLPENLPRAYAPKIKELRGSGRYKEFVTNALMVNAFHYHDDIIELFPGYKDVIKRIYSMQIAKNRNGEKKQILWLAFPDYNIFKEIK